MNPLGLEINVEDEPEDEFHLMHPTTAKHSAFVVNDVASHYSKYKVENNDLKKSTDDVRRWKQKVENRKA